MADIDTVIGALVTQLRAQLNEPTLTVMSVLDGNVTPPAILIDSPFQQTPTNLPETSFTETYPIIVVVPFSDQVSAQRQLRPYISATGAHSIRAALMYDPTLGGAVDGLQVGSPSQPGPVPVDEDEEVFVFGAVINVEIDT